jgi:hypothetical protein
MKCRSGQHEWCDLTDAERCCDPAWSRRLRPYGDADDLDPVGRRLIVPWMISGWVRVDEAAATKGGSDE